MMPTNAEFWSRFEERVAPYDLLKHPFYQAWSKGRTYTRGSVRIRSRVLAPCIGVSDLSECVAFAPARWRDAPRSFAQSR